jgi:transcriptional regulator with XRE-family HTH domain
MRLANNDALRRQEIRRFLVTRRAAIAPSTVGLPGGSRRRTPGLRREEVASLAGIGVTWYTWFEQGRDIRVSARALESIAQALRLTPSDTEYLFSLTGIPRSELAPADWQGVDQSIQDTIDGFQWPAMFGSPCLQILAYNRLADRIFEFDNYEGPFASNHIWRFFMDPRRRALYINWDSLAETSVRWMRSVHGKMLDDEYFTSLVRELCAGSKEFRRRWEAQMTAPPLDSVNVQMKLPRFGAVSFTSMRFRPLNSQQLMVLLLPVDENAAAVMREMSGGKVGRTKR